MKRVLSIVCMAALLATVFTMTAFAEGSDNYGFNTGKADNESRHAVYSQLGRTTEQVDKSGYVDSHVSGTVLTALDTEALVEAGIIDQDTADAIAAFGTAKHTSISGIYDGMDSMSPTARHEAFGERKTADGGMGNTVDALLEAEIITQEQADAITAWLAK